ncbi:hypothetical protein KV557_00190 [Kitasatospora aureofaciens]|uniref:hypothetical protein n=1 Tax=Kitasatospora aureofaciens TaxID=1894 RepID=UPI001C46AABD|nr:hypothetical protein [Kitasatospora aureofaciens]MBV6695545.1 hypothetical protein [Kitasatospora aureofaciens]
MAALRATGADVRPDPGFEYDAHPGYPSPSSVAAGLGTKIVTPGAAPVTPPAPVAAGRADVAVGTHPEHGITATNTSNSPEAARLLAKAGFYRVPDHPTLFALTRQEAGGVERATDTVARLRTAGLSVAADAAYDPEHAPDNPGDLFNTRLIKIAADPPAKAEVVEDPFATRIIPAPKQADRTNAPAAGLDPFATQLHPAPKHDAERTNAPAAGLDPFATQLHPAPARADADRRMGALLSNRQAALSAVEEILAGLSQQLRDDPQALDPAQVSAVLGQAQTTLGGVRRDLETISAAAPARAGRPVQAARPAVSPALGARAQAATTTSLRLGRVTTAQPVEAAAQPVDPRLAYSIHTR